MTVTLTHREHVACIKLNRPDVFNSVNREMALLFQRHLDDCAGDAATRAVMITGEGKAFCAGQDLAEVSSEDAPEIENIVSEHYSPIIQKIRNIEKPVICAVNGVAAGAGANIALAGDVVVACRSASFIQAFSKIGLIPDSGGTFLLPRLIGFQKASALMMTGDKVMAEDAERLGMVYRVFPDDSFAEAAAAIARTLASMPTRGLIYTKHLLNMSLVNDLSEQLAKEEEYQAKAGRTKDYAEGVSAFIEKRTPRFVGE